MENRRFVWTWDKVGDVWVSQDHDGMTYRVFADKLPNPIRWHFQAWDPLRQDAGYAVDTALIINHPGYWHEHAAFMAAERWATNRTFCPELFHATDRTEPIAYGAAVDNIRDGWNIINEHDQRRGAGISGPQQVVKTLLDALDTVTAERDAARALQEETACVNGILLDALSKRNVNIAVPVGTVVPPTPVGPLKWWYLENLGVFHDYDTDGQCENSYGPYDTYSEAFTAWSKDVSYDGPMFGLDGKDVSTPSALAALDSVESAITRDVDALIKELKYYAAFPHLDHASRLRKAIDMLERLKPYIKKG